jgi:hypothetical protein
MAAPAKGDLNIKSQRLIIRPDMAKDHQKDIDMSRMTSKIYVCNFRHQC